MKKLILIFTCIVLVMCNLNVVKASEGNETCYDDEGKECLMTIYDHYVTDESGPAKNYTYEQSGITTLVSNNGKVGIIKEYYWQPTYVYKDQTSRKGEATPYYPSKELYVWRQSDTTIYQLRIDVISTKENSVKRLLVDGKELNEDTSYGGEFEDFKDHWILALMGDDWKYIMIRFTEDSPYSDDGEHTITIEWESGYKEDWKYGKHYHMEFINGYWYEDGKKQGIYGDPKNVKDVNYGNIERGREIFDSTSNGWYWLDADAKGKKAVSKEVWMPYIYQNEDTFTEEQLNQVTNDSNTYTESSTTANMGEQVKKAIQNKEGKWVRYDENGKMYKGWVTLEGWNEKPEQNGNTYYYDYMTGLMAKGETIIDGKTYFFDEVTGVLQGNR